jgi:hypothetical protein
MLTTRTTSSNVCVGLEELITIDQSLTRLTMKKTVEEAETISMHESCVRCPLYPALSTTFSVAMSVRTVHARSDA